MLDKVLSRYPAELRRGHFAFLGNAGGFSGARLWRVDGDGGAFCMRSWPSDMTAERLGALHRWMRSAADAGLEFIPRVVATSYGATFVECADRHWEVTTWMRGRADFQAHPNPARLDAACRALARLHQVWMNVDRACGSCPAVRRRLERVEDWIKWAGSAPHAPEYIPRADVLHDQADRAWRIVQARIRHMPAMLAPWIDRPMALQPCHGDIWHDHFLFSGETVTGIIDFGSARMDHVAVDLARLLGSLTENDMAARARGLAAYRSIRALSDTEAVLSATLDETGIVVGLANWLMWLYRDKRTFEDFGAVARRLGTLLRRFDS